MLPRFVVPAVTAGSREIHPVEVMLRFAFRRKRPRKPGMEVLFAKHVKVKD